jgi:hypothetical protein
MRRKREQEADTALRLDVGVSDGRAIPGQSADAHQPRTQFHPLRRFARRDEPEAIDYTDRSTDRPSIHAARAPRTDLQRWTAPPEEARSWYHLEDDYYDGVAFAPPSRMGRFERSPTREYDHLGRPMYRQHWSDR